MRHSRSRRRGPVALCAALVSVLASAVLAASAAGVPNLYAPHSSAAGGGALAQFAVAGDGSLSALAPAALGPEAQDVAITPDGRFAYVTRGVGDAGGAIARFERGVGGRMEPVGSGAPAAQGPRGIVVNPQGTRLFYATQFSPAVHSHPIGADGSLGPASTTILSDSLANGFVAMTPSGTSLYVGTIDGNGRGEITQFDVDVASGALTPKAAPVVAWPGGAIAPPPDVARMTITPDGSQLYAATGHESTANARFPIDASGALGAGALAPPLARGDLVFVTAIAPDSPFLWAPTGPIASPAPGSGGIAQFSIGLAGVLTSLVPPSVAYAPFPELATRDALPNADGRSLYLAADANVAEWNVAPAGTLSARANHPIATTTSGGLALAPSQAPIASFAVGPSVAGLPTAFDATASFDPDGTVVRYDWEFGDGTALPNGGPTPTHVYPSPGTPTVALTVTDADGTSTAKLWTGTQMLRNGGPSARTARSFTVAAPPPAPPPPPRAPAPEKGRSVTIVPTQGTVRVRVPGSRRYVDVRLLREIPLGSRIDARRGRVRVTAEVDARTGRTQSSVFWDGIFVVRQTKGSKPILEARLAGGTFKGCTARVVARGFTPRALGGPLAQPFTTFATKKRSKRKVRRLWGRGEGSFRTGGRRSSATVRGTYWLVEDRCDGTLTRVRQGRVDVRDFRLRKTIRLRAGRRSIYLARAP